MKVSQRDLYDKEIQIIRLKYRLETQIARLNYRNEVAKQRLLSLQSKESVRSISEAYDSLNFAFALFVIIVINATALIN